MTTRRTVNIREASEMLGISERKLGDLVRSGDIPSVRFGRRVVITVAVIDKLLGEDTMTLAKPLAAV